MATIIDPPTPPSNLDNAIAVRPGQPLRLEANASTNWWRRINGGAWAQQNGGATAVFVWTTPTSVVRRFTFDEIQVAAETTVPGSLYTGGIYLNLCEGPAVPLLATSSLSGAPRPPLDPNLDEHDDPPIGTPWTMPAASRGGFGTARLEEPSVAGGPANLVAALGPGVFVDSAGRLGVRTPIFGRVRGLGPYPAITSYYHVGQYFNYDFGRSRSLGLTRVLYENGAIAVVRGDGRRTSYRTALVVGTYRRPVGVESTLTKDGSGYYEATPSGTTFTYSTGRLLQKVVDRYGNPVYYSYDVNSRLQKVGGLSGSAGLVPYLAYDGSGLCSMVVLEDAGTPANNRSTYFTYDGNRNLTRIIGPELCITYFEYNSPDAISAVTDPEGFRWYFAYDASGRVSRVVDALGAATYFAFDTTVSPSTAVFDRAGKATYFQYNAFGYPSRVLNFGTPADYFGFDYQGDLTSSKNRLGREWTYQYDSRGNRISINDPLAARTYFAFDGTDLVRTLIDPLGRSTYFGYDGSRNLTSVTDPSNKSTYFGYQSTGLLRFQKNRRGNFTYFGFDARANLTATVDALGFQTYLEFNSAGERTRVFDARQNAAYLAYDLKGRVVQTKDAYLNSRFMAYDGRCNLVTEVDPRGKIAYHAYDGNSNRTKTSRRMDDASFLATYFRYDPEERLAGQKDARLNETYWVYDALGRRQKQVDALGNESYWAYDDAHEVTRQLMPAQAAGVARATTYYSYDVVGRRQQVIDPGMLLTYSSYDLKGNVRFTNIDQGWGLAPWGCSPYGGERATTYLEYDANDRRTKQIDALGNQTYWVFDAEGNIDRSVNARLFGTYYTYDALNRTTHVKDGVHFAVTYSGYDAVGNVVRGIDQQAYETYLTFDKLNRQESVAGPFGVSGSVDAYRYFAYDAASNRVETRVENPRGSDRRSTYYEFDAVNRITRVIDPEAENGAVRGFTVTEYDLVGNRTKVVDQEGRPTYFSYDAVNRNDTRKNASLNTWTIVYDGRNAVAKQIDPVGRTGYFEYDLAGRQTQQSNVLGERSYFCYDARGQRTTTTNPRGYSTSVRFDRLGRRTHHIDANNSVRYFVYDEVGNQLRSIDELGKTTYFTYDGLDRQTHVKDQAAAATYAGYDSRSSMVLRLDADNRSTYMGYDPVSRRTKVWFAAPSSPDAPIYYSYDTVGNMTTVQDDTIASANYFHLDRLDRLTKKMTIAGWVYYEYDKAGLKARLTDPAFNKTYYGYDSAGRLSFAELLDGTPRRQYYEYDASGMLTKRTAPENRVLSYYDFDNAGRTSQIIARSSTGTVISYFAYVQRNANGDAERVLREAGKAEYYSFDTLDRLTNEDYRDPLAGSPHTYGWYYDFDAASNRTRKQDKVTGLTSYYTYDNRNLLSREFMSSNITNYYGYDAAQRMTQQYTNPGASPAQAFYYSYNQRNMATKLINKQPSGQDLPRYFSYNGAGEAIAVVDTDDVALPRSYWAFDGNKLVLDNTPSALCTYYRHNWSPGEPSLIEVVNSGNPTQTGSPAFDERGSVCRSRGVMPSEVNESFAFNFHGESLGATSGAVDQRQRFSSTFLLRATPVSQEVLLSAGQLFLPRLGGLVSSGVVGFITLVPCLPSLGSGMRLARGDDVETAKLGAELQASLQVERGCEAQGCAMGPWIEEPVAECYDLLVGWELPHIICIATGAAMCVREGPRRVRPPVPPPPPPPRRRVGRLEIPEVYPFPRDCPNPVSGRPPMNGPAPITWPPVCISPPCSTDWPSRTEPYNPGPMLEVPCPEELEVIIKLIIVIVAIGLMRRGMPPKQAEVVAEQIVRGWAQAR